MKDDPLYRSIQQKVAQDIDAGLYPPGSQLPGEKQLARTHGVSVLTVRRALADLVWAGRIVRVQGKGSFVCDPKEASERTSLRIVTFVALAIDKPDDSVMEVIRGAQLGLSQLGYTMTLEFNHDNVQSENEILHGCADETPLGVLLFSTDPEANASAIRLLEGRGVPVVLIDRGTRNTSTSLVSSNNLDGAYQMCAYLLGRGHRAILFAADSFHLLSEKERYEGFLMALREADVAPLQEGPARNAFHEPRAAIETALRLGATAIQCVNDRTAIRLLDILKQMDISVPQRLSIAGFDDFIYAAMTNPALTTVRQNFFEVGKAAAAMLVGQLERREGKSAVYIPVTLVLRDSVGDGPSYGGSSDDQTGDA